MRPLIVRVTKLIAICLVAIIAFGEVLAAEIPAGTTVDGVYRPDWKALVEANEAVPQDTTVPAGEIWIAYQSDMEHIRKIGRINRNVDFRFGIYGTLIIEDTTDWFYVRELAPRGGTIVKRGTTDLIGGVDNWNYKGKLIVEGGSVAMQSATMLGNGSSTVCDYEVKAGGTFKMHFVGTLGSSMLKIAGNGKDGLGAAVVTYCNDGLVGSLVLSDDATFTDDRGGDVIRSVDLNGKTLTMGGTMGAQTRHVFNGTSFSNGGAVVFAAATGTRAVRLSGTTDFSNVTSVTFPDNAWLEFLGATAFAAPIVANGKLTVTSQSSADLLFSGSISGAGNLAFGNVTWRATGSITLAQSNSWTGTTTLTGASGFQLKLKYGTSIPDYTKLTINGGTLVPVPGYDGAGLRWTNDQLLGFSSNMQVTASTRTITYDTTELTGSPALTFGSSKVAEYFPNLDVIWDASGTGEGSYTLTGPYTTDKPLDINLTGGSIRLSGNDQINLDDVLVSGTSATQGGTLILDGAKDVVFGEQMIAVGAKVASDVLGHMVVKDAVLRSTYIEENTAETSKAKGHLWVGSNAKGILEIEEGGIISNKVYAGGGGYGSLSGTGVGVVYQRGGVFAPVVNSQSYASTSLGMFGYGFYQMTDGLVRPWGPGTPGAFAVGAYGTATFIQNGGTVDLSGVSSLALGANGDGVGEYCIRKGRTWAKMLVTAQAGGTGRGVMTVDGPAAEFVSQGSTYFNYYPDKTTVVNMNRGGTLQVRCFRQEKANADYTSPFPTIVNFNGGILRTLAQSEIIFASGEGKGVNKVAVYEGGATIENDGVALTRFTPIVAAGEGGIQTVLLGGPVAGLVAPNVTITGDGYGATAIAEFNADTRTVTNILITSRGWGYTQAGTSIKLRDGLTDIAALEFTVGASAVGGFTKMGIGNLQLYNQNTWAQWTKVLGGTLQVMEAGAVPNGTALTISNGATIDFNGHEEPTFTAIDGTGGTAANGSVKVIGENGVLSVSAQKFIDRETTAIVGTLDLSKVTEIVLTDTDVLTEEAKSLKGLNLFSATTIVLPTEDISVAGVPKGWHTRLTDHGFRLAPDSGMAIILR